MYSKINPTLVVALDVSTAAEAVQLAEKFTGLPVWVKVGLELFTACGPEVVEKMQGLNFPVFLDLKFHDIPNTVAKAVASAVHLRAQILTLHCAGGKKMLQAAVAERNNTVAQLGIPPPLLLGVTVLTSVGAEELGLSETELHQHIVERATLAKEAGLDGVVCSGLEVEAIKKECGASFICLCPGIRFQGAQQEDQARVVTPDDAVRRGANYLVMGRPLREAKNPIEATKRALSLMDISL